ncbi:MAG: asparaginase [Intrasporangium sp.]|uniref:asparaginase n=1 Tax=Intrasporangium sp. TaxID=1925024 RepID=UPI0026485CA3|nr:asparaginase [Intrasporangium sp.]MDN5796993.1 asparaginase [Intrasporangium sp.]
MVQPGDGLALRSRPTVGYVALGGTIASVPSEAPGAQPGVQPTLTAADLAAGVPGLEAVAVLEAHTFRTIPSSAITLRDLIELVPVLLRVVEGGAAGVVVSQGTDTIEEVAFVLDLLWDRPEPVVVTGAMRNPSMAGPDGPANLLASVQVAAEPDARDCGVLVCLNDEIHAARFVHKSHTCSPSTFHSPGLGPLGWVAEGRPVIALRPTRRAHVQLDWSVALPRVPIVTLGLGADAVLLEALCDLECDGVVIEGMGGGHVPAGLLPAVGDLLERVPVVLTSRTGSGEVLATTYGYPGGEIDLLDRGVIRAGALDSLKARLLLVLAMASGCDRPATRDLFALVGTTTGPVAKA